LTNATEAGYSIAEQVFDGPEMAGVCEALARADLVRTKAGARHILSVPAVRAPATRHWGTAHSV
jgi:hypothetical protein